MANISAAMLTDRSVLGVSGADAAEFLQGLITNDIKGAADGRAIHAGLLTPQGKILFEFIISGADDGYLIDCAAAYAGALAKRLGMYKLRSKVEISDLSTSHGVAALWPQDGAQISGAFADPRLGAMGARVIAESAALDAALTGAGAQIHPLTDYHTRRIGLGVPEMGQDYDTGEVFPHEANFDMLGGVHFNKGCYVGQEVVSRMKHKTSIRKRFIPVVVEGDMPAMGAEVQAGGKGAGAFGSGSGGRGLALIRFDRIEGADAISAGNATLRPQKPDWAEFDIPGVET